MTPRVANRQSSGTSELDAQVAVAPNGVLIHLAPGQYDAISDRTARRGWVTISGSGDRPKPVIEGAAFDFGASYVRFVDVRFSAGVSVFRSSNISLLDSTIDCGSTTTTPAAVGIEVRLASTHVWIEGDRVSHCVVGFRSLPQDHMSSDITITHDLFQDFPGDAIDLGGVEDVTIAHDVIRRMLDPSHAYHNDGIQFFGNTANVAIEDSVLSDSGAQLIFIQDALAGTEDHSAVNQNITVKNNLIYGANGVAVQDQAGVDVSIIGNTIWTNHYGSLWLVRSTFSGLPPAGTKIEDNLIQSFSLFDATAGEEKHNLILNGPRGYKYGPGDIISRSPQFVDPGRGNFKLAPGSPGAVLSQKAALETDADNLYGVDSTHRALGAIQAADPGIAYGAPYRNSSRCLLGVGVPCR